MSSEDLLEKYEYWTGEDLGYKPSVFEKAKFEYSSLGVALPNNFKNKTNKNNVHNKNKQYKYLVYHSQHSFTRFKDINEFKETNFIKIELKSLDSMYKRLNEF